MWLSELPISKAVRLIRDNGKLLVQTLRLLYTALLHAFRAVIRDDVLENGIMRRGFIFA